MPFPTTQATRPTPMLQQWFIDCLSNSENQQNQDFGRKNSFRLNLRQENYYPWFSITNAINTTQPARVMAFPWGFSHSAIGQHIESIEWTKMRKILWCYDVQVQDILRRMSGNKVIFVAGGRIDDCRRKVGGRRQIILPFLLLVRCQSQNKQMLVHNCHNKGHLFPNPRTGQLRECIS